MGAAYPDPDDEIRSLPMFAGLAPELVADITRCASCLELERARPLFRQGEPPHAFFHVLAGHVRQVITSPKGDEWVIDIVAAGQHVGLPELFGDAPYLSFAETVGPATVLRIGGDGLLRAVGGDSALALRVLNAVARHKARFEREVAACFFQPGCRRVLDYLVREAGLDQAPRRGAVVELPVSKRLVAARIGMTAESLSRALRKLTDADLIRVRGRKIQLLDKVVDHLAGPGPELDEDEMPRRRGELRLSRSRRAEAGREPRLQGA